MSWCNRLSNTTDKPKGSLLVTVSLRLSNSAWTVLTAQMQATLAAEWRTVSMRSLNVILLPYHISPWLAS